MHHPPHYNHNHPVTTENLSANVRSASAQMRTDLEAADAKLRRLRNLDFFILDNSIRESSVGQLRNHTLADKKAIYNEVNKCRINSIIVACFSHMRRVDDDFCEWLQQTQQDFSRLFSFSEISGGKIVNGQYDAESIPVALEKNKEYGLFNTLFEIDLADRNIAWGTKWSTSDTCKLIDKWVSWVRENLNPNARIGLNFRDMPAAFASDPERVLSVVEHFAKMPEQKSLFGLMFEDPLGESMPEQMAAWTRAIRTVMNSCGWTHGRLLNHIHEKWEMQTAVTLECLASGSDGVWASLCVEGSAMGHASSTVTAMNLVRLGNRKVLHTYNCKEFRNSAIQVTTLTTSKLPDQKQCVYGERALDLVFDTLGEGEFNIVEFFGWRSDDTKPLTSSRMAVYRLTHLFGYNKQFTLCMGRKMLKTIQDDITSLPSRKEDYRSAMGLAVLFARSGGELTPRMKEAIYKLQKHKDEHEKLLKQVKNLWDYWGPKHAGGNCQSLDYESFYHGFLSPYIGCYRFKDTKRTLQSIKRIDQDGNIEWKDFLVYLKWALAEYPETPNADELIEIAYQRGMVPVLRSMSCETTGMRKSLEICCKIVRY